MTPADRTAPAPLPEPVRRLALRFNTIAIVAVLLAILSYCLAEGNSLDLAVISMVGCAIGWSVGRGKRVPGVGYSARPLGLPKWAVNLLVLAALIHATFAVLGDGSGSFRTGTPVVSILAQFLVYIQLIKLLDRPTPRDDGHLLGLSVFIVIGSILTSNDFLAGSLLIIYTPLVIWAAMLLQLIGGHRAAMNAGAPISKPSGTPLVVGRTAWRDLRRLGAGSLALIVGLATLAFILTPRGLGEDFMGAFGKVGSGSQVGFTDTVQLGRSGRLGSDTTPVLDVRVFDSQNQNIGAQLGSIYLRGAVNNYYNPQTRSWEDRPVPVPLDDRDIPPLSSARPSPVTLSQTESTVGVIRQQITCRRGKLRDSYLFTMLRPIRIVGVSRDITLNPRRRDSVLKISDDADPRLLTYTIDSAPEFTDPRDEGRFAPGFDNARIAELARGVLDERGIRGDPSAWTPEVVRRAATSLQDYLRATCTYSLDQIPPQAGEDPIEMFVFRTKQGHCEYFASAMVAMCQSVGIDARIAAGYLAANFNSSTGAFLVLQSNAHAWVEVRLSPGRWQQFDPSPPDAVSREHRGSGGIFARLRRLYDTLNLTWSSAIISFDRSKQSGLIGSDVSSSADSWMQRLRDVSLPALVSKLSLSRVLGLIFAAGCMVLLLVTLRRALPSIRRRLGRRSGGYPHADPATDAELRALLEGAAFYPRLLRELRRAGLAKPDSRPPLAHAAIIAESGPSIAADTELLSRLFYQVRFARTPLDTEQEALARAAIDRISLQARAPRRAPRPAV
ncbi:MAG: DUF3488 and DUF4129 domain-containing transglutaminase family protein [Phycisphaerales bacterium]